MNESRICVTYFNISWDVFTNIECGNVSYEVSISPPPIDGDAVMNTTDRFFSVIGLNNSVLDIAINVTASNRAGKGNATAFYTQLPTPLGKHYINIGIC